MTTAELNSAIRARIDAAPDYEALRAAIVSAYAETATDALTGRLGRALALSELAGYLSILLDCPDGVERELLLNNGGWRVPALFSRAVGWFREQVQAATTVPVQYDMAERPRARAAPLASAAHLDTATRLIRHIEAQRDAGLPVEAMKQELREALHDLGLTPGGSPIAESLPIREELQRAFATSRTEVLSVDFYREAYPFWRYSSVMDERTTQGCRGLDGLTMPAKDPRWEGFTPPRHWKCRAHILAVVHSDGMRAAKHSPDPEYIGQGAFATLDEQWEPRPGNYPPDLWEIYLAANKSDRPHLEIPGPWWRKDYNPADWVGK